MTSVYTFGITPGRLYRTGQRDVEPFGERNDYDGRQP